MGVGVLVVRHPEDGFPQRVAAVFDGHVINAGDGAHAHPTQALLDMYTLIEEFDDLRGRTVAIVGDVAHSRVAHSLIVGLQRPGANVVLVGPAGVFAGRVMPMQAARRTKLRRRFCQRPTQSFCCAFSANASRTMPISDAEYVRDIASTRNA